jgi:hypothetical protein
MLDSLSVLPILVAGAIEYDSGPFVLQHVQVPIV